MIFKTSSCRPCWFCDLKSHESCEAEAIKVDRVAKRGVSVWLGNWTDEHPLWCDKNIDSNVRPALESQEFSALHVDGLQSRLIGPVTRIQSADAVLELVLWDHDQSFFVSLLLKLFTRCFHFNGVFSLASSCFFVELLQVRESI